MAWPTSVTAIPAGGGGTGTTGRGSLRAKSWRTTARRKPSVSTSRGAEGKVPRASSATWA